MEKIYTRGRIYKCHLHLLLILAAASSAAIRDHTIYRLLKITDLYQQNQDYERLQAKCMRLQPCCGPLVLHWDGIKFPDSAQEKNSGLAMQD